MTQTESSKNEPVPRIISALDSLQKSFLLSPPMVACLVRHIDGTMSEVTTPQSIDHCVVELQSYFQPHIDACRISERCVPGFKLKLQFGKTMNLNTVASSSLLNVYIFAIDQGYSRPRLLAHVAKKWRALLAKTNQEKSCFVMLYHKDLVDAACVSVNRVKGFVESSGVTKEPIQKNLNEAAAALDKYFMELKALQFAPHQMCVYMPNEAPIRLVERLRVAYVEQTSRLSTAFENYARRRQSCLLQVDKDFSIDSNKSEKKSLSINTVSSKTDGVNGVANVEVWSLQKYWRKGYKLAMHFIQFGALEDAIATFSKMFGMYYYHSEDYDFVKSTETLVRLSKLSNVFDPTEFSTEENGYPSALRDGAEFVEGLLFILACETQCALLLEHYETVYTRYRSFLQVAREKFTSDTSLKVTGAWELFFLMRCALSAMRLKWVLGEVTKDYEVALPSSESRADTGQVQTFYDDNNTSKTSCYSRSNRIVSIVESDIMSTTVSQQNETSISFNSLSFVFVNNTDKNTEMKSKMYDKNNKKYAFMRMQALCYKLNIDYFSITPCIGRLLAKLAGDALEFLVDLGVLLGYSITGEVVAPLPQSLSSAEQQQQKKKREREEKPAADVFNMPEIVSAANFASFYRTLTEMSAIGFYLANDRRLEHVLYYKLALSYSVDDPDFTADLCLGKLIPFFSNHSWLQLQIIAHSLFVESMELAMQRRQQQKQQQLLKNEETVALKESLLYIIGALNKRGELRKEISFLCSRKTPEELWCRFKRVDNIQNCSVTLNCVQSYNIMLVLREPCVFCLHCNDLPDVKSSKLETIALNAATGATPTAKISANIGEKIFLFFTAICPIDMLKSHTDNDCSGKNDESYISLTATLVSKKDWEDETEATHVFNVTHVVQSSYEETEQRLCWIWKLQPCRAGEYRLRSITLSLAATKLVYTRNETTAMILFSESSSPISLLNNGANTVETMPKSLFFVPEPEIGINLRIEKAVETHCFGDSLTFFSLYIEVEKPLYTHFFSHNSNNNSFSSLMCSEAFAKDAVCCKNCFFETIPVLNLLENTTSFATCSNGLRNRCQAKVVEPPLMFNPKTLAVIYVSHSKLSNTSPDGILAFDNSKIFSRDLNGSLKLESSAIASQKVKFVPFAESPLGSTLVNQSTLSITITDENTGAFTIVPVNEQFVMSNLMSLDCIKSVDKSVDSDDNDIIIAKECKPTCMHLEGSINASLKQEYCCCFQICLDCEEEKLAKEDFDNLLKITRLKCSIPLLPFFMSSGNGAALVSLSCQHNMESRTTSVTTSLRFTQAFAVRYTFKPFQSRIYCLVQVKNVLEKTSLWLRGALLEILDVECHYKLSRVSSAHEHLMLREWRPQETINMLFELKPLVELCIRKKEMRHSVRLQLLYSSWSSAAVMKPLRAHILHPLTPHVSCSLRSSSTPVMLEQTKTVETETPLSYYDIQEELQFSELGSSFSSKTNGDLLFCPTRETEINYDPAQLDKFRSTCNTFYAPVGMFTSKHMCLFNIFVFVDPSHPTNQSSHMFEAAGTTQQIYNIKNQNRYDINNKDTPLVDVSPVNLPCGSVFPVGEPICFSVTFEPLAYNWPDDGSSEEEFWITFKADPAAWSVTGKQRLRHSLSVMEDVTLHFTAIPLPTTAGDELSVDSDGVCFSCFPQKYCQEFGLQKTRYETGRKGQKLSVVATPTVEVHWASSSRHGASGSGSEEFAKDDAVAIEVVQFRRSMRIQH